jgi:hypothetical protein
MTIANVTVGSWSKNRGCFIISIRFSPLLIDAWKTNHPRHPPERTPNSPLNEALEKTLKPPDNNKAAESPSCLMLLEFFLEAPNSHMARLLKNKQRKVAS